MIKWILKAAAGGAIAFIILSAFSAVYFNTPVYTENPTGETECMYNGGQFYSYAYEGFSCGFTDSRGFKNSAVPEGTADILIMGSSHMEAFQVSQQDSAADKLAALFGGSRTVYNIGISGHTLLYNVSNLEKALEKYKPSYVIIETGEIIFSDKETEKVFDDSLDPLITHQGKLAMFLKKFPCVSLLHNQYYNTRKTGGAKAKTPASEDNTEKLFGIISRVCGEYNVRPIILYHPHIAVDSDGLPHADTDTETLEMMKGICERENIIFADMTDTFIGKYNDEYILPHGFANTSAGKGHLNRYGHEMAAEKLYEAIIADGEK